MWSTEEEKEHLHGNDLKKRSPERHGPKILADKDDTFGGNWGGGGGGGVVGKSIKPGENFTSSEATKVLGFTLRALRNRKNPNGPLRKYFKWGGGSDAG